MNGTLRSRDTTRNLERAENPTKRPHSYLKIAWKNVSLWDRNSVNPQLKAPSPACLLPPLLCSESSPREPLKIPVLPTSSPQAKTPTSDVHERQECARENAEKAGLLATLAKQIMTKTLIF